MLHLLPAALLGLPMASAGVHDEIELVNGRVLSVERVTAETYTEVRYRTLGGGEGRKPADEVQKVVHDASSALLEDYVLGLEQMESGDFSGAVATFAEVMNDNRVVGRSTFAWVRQHVRYRQARCLFSLADFGGCVEAVDVLLSEVPDTFFYAPALLLKAEALRSAGRRDDADGVFRDLAAAVASKGLPDRWEREAELGRLLLDQGLKGKALQQKLQQLVEKNREKYPTVASRARVEIGNSMVQEKDFTQAESFFKKIVEEGQADDTTIAAAYMGLGDCAYQRGLNFDDPSTAEAQATFQEAVLAYLRVVTIYKEQISMVPRALARAAMSLDRMGGEENRRDAIQMVGRLDRYFPNSPWLKEVKQQLRLR